MRLVKYVFEIFSIMLLTAQLLFAGTTGKIQGRVTDKKTGEPLPGVNVIIIGTNIGSATDANGDYFILQVPPGNYSVKASMIGYQEVVVQNVDVKVDLTTRINFEIEEKTVELEDEVVIIAEKPIIRKDVTSSTQFV